jgi:hypothetical protein
MRDLVLNELCEISGGQGRGGKPPAPLTDRERGFEEAINNYWNPGPDTLENMRRASGNISFQDSLLGQAIQGVYEAVASKVNGAIQSAVGGLSAAWDAYVKEYADSKEDALGKKNY